VGQFVQAPLPDSSPLLFPQGVLRGSRDTRSPPALQATCPGSVQEFGDGPPGTGVALFIRICAEARSSSIRALAAWSSATSARSLFLSLTGSFAICLTSARASPVTVGSAALVSAATSEGQSRGGESRPGRVSEP
jgi:hypothetical protein